MVDREGDGAAEGVEGTDYLTRRRGLYMKDYEFLECHEWWTEMETVQAKGGGNWLFDKEEGNIYEKLRISLISPMVDRDEDDAAEKRRRTFFFIIEQGIITEKGWFFIKKA